MLSTAEKYTGDTGVKAAAGVAGDRTNAQNPVGQSATSVIAAGEPISRTMTKRLCRNTMNARKRACASAAGLREITKRLCVTFAGENRMTLV